MSKSVVLTALAFCSVAVTLSAQTTEWLEPVQRGWQTDVFVGPDEMSSGARTFSVGMRRALAGGTSPIGVRAGISWVHHREESGYPYYFTCVSYQPTQGCHSEVHRIRENVALVGGELDAEAPIASVRVVPFVGGGVVPMALIRDEMTICTVADGGSYPYACDTQRDSVYRREKAFGGYFNIGVGMRIERLLVRVNFLALATTPSPYASGHANVLIGWRF